MSKHKGHREPRRRGFDEDNSGLDYAEPAFFQRQPATTAAATDATVSWFNAVKGFGFVKLSDGSDAFLHVRALESAGHNDIGEGTPIKVRVEQGPKGKQVTEVVEVGEAVMPARSAAPREERPQPVPAGDEKEAVGTVKWYEPAKGFGFISVPDLPKDLFVHVSALRRSGLDTLQEGESVRVTYQQGKKGPEARTVTRE